MRVLVVCHGNINRSPLCAALLARGSSLKIRSAGFANPGKRATKKMREAAAGMGLDLEAHRSQKITPELVKWAQAIVYMDGGNLRRLQLFSLTTKVKLPRLICLAKYAPQDVPRIPDPNFMARSSQEFRYVVELIQDTTAKLREELSK